MYHRYVKGEETAPKERETGMGKGEKEGEANVRR